MKILDFIIKLIDGHNFEMLFDAFDELEKVKGPKLLHVKTIKGKGYYQAEKTKSNGILWFIRQKQV